MNLLRFFYDADPELKKCISQIQMGAFSPQEPALFSDLVNILLNHDNYMLCKDYRSYVDCQVIAEAMLASVGAMPRDVWRCLASYCGYLYFVTNELSLA